jgi:hypothetical protein
VLASLHDPATTPTRGVVVVDDPAATPTRGVVVVDDPAATPTRGVVVVDASVVPSPSPLDCRCGAVVVVVPYPRPLHYPCGMGAGCNEGLVPLTRLGDTGQDMYEEGRLFYVSMTRAKQQLYLIHHSYSHQVNRHPCTAAPLQISYMQRAYPKRGVGPTCMPRHAAHHSAALAGACADGNPCDVDFLACFVSRLL